MFPPPRRFTAHYAAARKLAAPTRLPAAGALAPRWVLSQLQRMVSFLKLTYKG